MKSEPHMLHIVLKETRSYQQLNTHFLSAQQGVAEAETLT